MFMLAAQAAEATAAAKVAEKAGITLVESGVLGALLLLSVTVNILLIRKLLQVQDKRVTDKESDNQRLTQLTITTSETVAKVASAVNALEQSDKLSASLLQSFKGNLDLLVTQTLIHAGLSPAKGNRLTTQGEGAER